MKFEFIVGGLQLLLVVQSINGFIIRQSSASASSSIVRTTATIQPSSFFKRSVAIASNNNNDNNDECILLNNEHNTNDNNNSNVLNTNRRRNVIVGGIALASMILESSTGTNIQSALASTGSSTTSADDTTTTIAAASPARTIFITGANSGIGYEAVKRLAVEPGTTVLVACRTKEKADNTIDKIRDSVSIPVDTTLLPIVCDLANLQSIDSCVDQLKQYNIQAIDVLALNAGISRNVDSKECLRTSDGFELTIGTNHFGHFYLFHNLLPLVQSKIVVTASSVHDPNSPGGAQGEKATLGNLQGLINSGRSCEMIDGQPFNADKAYKDSKLCNVLFTRELQRRIDTNGGISIMANSFTPGLIVGTGLFRDQNPIFTKLFDIAATNLIKVGETPAWGGAALTYMINNVTTKGLYYYSPPGSSAKYSEQEAFHPQRTPVIFGPVEVSIEAQDDAKAKLLWELSEKLLDIKTSL